MMATGRRLLMLIMMISEMPLPMPRAVIWSPSHMTSIEAAVMEMMVSRRKPQPGLATRLRSPMPRKAGFSSMRAMKKPWKRQMKMVK